MSTTRKKLYKIIIIGHLVVNIPVILFSFIPAVFLFVYSSSLLLKITLGIAGFITGIIASWFYWSFVITKWRIWAFRQIEEEEWLRLHHLAEDNYLLWGRGHPFEQTEIRDEIEDFLLQELSERMYELEQIEELKIELSLEEVSRYRLSKRDNVFESLMMVLVMSIGVGNLFFKTYPLGIIILLIVLWNYKKFNYAIYAISEKYFLLIDDQGITIGADNKNDFRWEEILSVNVSQKEKKMMIECANREGFSFDLWRLEIGDYRLFEQQLEAYYERHLQMKK